MKPSNRAPKPRRRPAVRLQLSVIVPTFNERDNVTVLYRRLEAALAGIAWEVVFVDDNSPDGTWAVVRGAGAAGSPRALHPPDRAARPVRRLHRGHSGLERAVRRGDRRRPAARRNPAAEDARAAAERRGRSRGRQPLYRRRQRRQFQQAARRRQPAGHRGRQTRAAGRDRRSHERLLHDPPRPLRATGAAALDPGLQDPARHRRHRARQAARPSKFPTPSARGCMARASSIPWWRWISSAWCWRS